MLDLREPAGSGPRPSPYVDVQLRDANGRPAPTGGAQNTPQPLHITETATHWAAEMSAPTSPGAYHVHLFVRGTGGPDAEYDLPAPVLTVVPQVDYNGGLVYSRNGNLWRTDTNGLHTHLITFYNGDGRADGPAWSPDGLHIAFTRTLPAEASQIPDSELWESDPSGAQPHPLVTRRADEDLASPAFAPDAALLFTSDRTIDPATGSTPTLDRLTAADESWRIARQDASGARTTLVQSGQMPDMAHDGRLLAYIGAPDALAESETLPTHTLMLADGGGSAPRVLVPGDSFQDVFAPHISPDGAAVAFAAVNRLDVPDGLNLLQILGLDALPARANGLPWDIYLVPSAGGTPARITHLNADLPFPAWSPDGKTLAILDEKGLFLLDMSHPTAPLRQIGPGSSHGQLAWSRR